MVFAALLVALFAAVNSAATEEPDLRFFGGQTRITGDGCTCFPRTESCICCGMVEQSFANIHEKGCATIRYRWGNGRSIKYDFTLRDVTVSRTEPPGTKDPTELCIPVAFLTVCTQFFNVEFENAAFTFCFRFDVKYSKFTLLAFDFDCVRILLVPGITTKVKPANLLPGSFTNGSQSQGYNPWQIRV